MSVRRHGVARWLAILAIALQAFWPLLSAAKPRSVTLVPICTVGGETHYMELETGGANVSHEDHCKACPVGAAALATVAPAFDVPKDSSAPIFACGESAAERRLPSRARPRAPPSDS